jgi:hypothetical protein
LNESKETTHFVDGNTLGATSNGAERFAAGYAYAKENFDKLIAPVLDKDGVQNQTVQFVSHSMGSAYAEGMIKYFEEQNIVVSKVVHLSPADPNDFTASTKPNTTQLTIENDIVLAAKDGYNAGKTIVGADRNGIVETERGMMEDLINSHGDTKLKASTWKYVSDLDNMRMTPTNTVINTWYPSILTPIIETNRVYKASGNTHGTQFNSLYITGKGYSDSYRLLNTGIGALSISEELENNQYVED